MTQIHYDALKKHIRERAREKLGRKDREEKDLYWGENQLELIEQIGVQNWLVQQL